MPHELNNGPARPRVMRIVLSVLGAILLLATAGCSADQFLSQSGPSRADLVSQAFFRAQQVRPDQELQYVLVPLNQGTIPLLATDEEIASFPGGLTDKRPADGLIGIGDQISITVFESDSGGLFLPREGGTRSGNFVTVPVQQVGRDGTIDMPYAGTLRAAGMTPRALSAVIQDRLSNRALEPQVVVAIVDRRAGPISVLGEVNSATHFTLDPGGARILEAVARAGGARFPAYESMVTLQREGRIYNAMLSVIARDTSQNLELRPNDVVYVAHQPRYFLAMGAIGQSASFGPLDRRFTFNDDHIMLVDALGRAGGLLDERSNAAGIFVYRRESREKIISLGIDAKAALPEIVPTVFLLNLGDPAGYFYASRFAVRHEDILFVSNAPATDLIKFLNIVVLGSGSAAAIRSTVQ